MDNLTYQQVLADVYEEIGATPLVHQTEYTEEVLPEDKLPNELEDQEDFNKQHGSRHEAGKLADIDTFVDRTTTSVTYKQKQIKLHQFNIDSKFRSVKDPYKQTIQTPTSFTFTFPDKIKNVISMRASGIEIPNSYYVFTALKNNTYFSIVVGPNPTKVITIPDGNYEDPYVFADKIQTLLNAEFPTTDFSVTLGDNTAKLTITNSTSTVFSLDFTTPLTAIQTSDNGIGFNMGFRNTTYVNQFSYTGEAVVDTIGPNYIFLSLGTEYPVLRHFYNNTYVPAFAKILVNVAKNAILTDNGSNMITKEYTFPQPKDLTHVHIKVLDAYNEIVDIQGLNFSFSLEVVEVVNHALYNTLTEPIT
jgi:hypothetical protein